MPRVSCMQGWACSRRPALGIGLFFFRRKCCNHANAEKPVILPPPSPTPKSVPYRLIFSPTPFLDVTRRARFVSAMGLKIQQVFQSFSKY